MSSLFTELKRRNVFRVAAAYAVVGWLIVQVGDVAADSLGFPGWFMPMLFVVLGLGFPLALLLSWAYEMTPDGVKRTEDVAPAESVTPRTGRRIDRLIVVGLLAVISIMAVERVWFAGRGEDAPTTTAAAPVEAAPTSAGAESVIDKSIAVLPFADFSPGGNQGWFADGLAEEILNALARTPDLLVSARTSSFKYKGSTLAIPQIAAELGVAHVLEGSVRSTPQRIRVTAQLIRAADGFHLWSETYDRDPADLIEIQEDLARKIAAAMQTSMDPAALSDMAQVGTHSVEAYQVYLRGVADSLASDPATFQRAYQLFEKARALDPTFAAAHARAASYWLVQLDPTSRFGAPVDVSLEVIRERFRERIDLAVEHATRDVDRHVSRALKAQFDLRFREAVDLQRQVLAERPMDRDALASLLELLTLTSETELMQVALDQAWALAFERQDWANLHLIYAHRGPDRHRAADQALELARRWWDDPGNLYQAQRALLWDGRIDAAREVFERWRALAGPSQWSSIPAARQASAEGRCDEAARILDDLEPGDISQRWHVLMLLDRREEAAQLLMPFERSGNVQALAGFLGYRHFDPTPFPSLMRVLERERVQRPAVEPLPFACKPSGADS